MFGVNRNLLAPAAATPPPRYLAVMVLIYYYANIKLSYSLENLLKYIHILLTNCIPTPSKLFWPFLSQLLGHSPAAVILRLNKNFLHFSSPLCLTRSCPLFIYSLSLDGTLSVSQDRAKVETVFSISCIWNVFLYSHTQYNLVLVHLKARSDFASETWSIAQRLLPSCAAAGSYQVAVTLEAFKNTFFFPLIGSLHNLSSNLVFWNFTSVWWSELIFIHCSDMEWVLPTWKLMLRN